MPRAFGDGFGSGKTLVAGVVDCVFALLVFFLLYCFRFFLFFFAFLGGALEWRGWLWVQFVAAALRATGAGGGVNAVWWWCCCCCNCWYCVVVAAVVAGNVDADVAVNADAITIAGDFFGLLTSMLQVVVEMLFFCCCCLLMAEIDADAPANDDDDIVGIDVDRVPTSFLFLSKSNIILVRHWQPSARRFYNARPSQARPLSSVRRFGG